MKLNVCDVCASEGVLKESWGKSRMKSKGASVAIDICESHKGTFKGKTFDEFLKYSRELEQKYWDIKLKDVKPILSELKLAKLK